MNKNMETQKIFNDIYSNNSWRSNESKSGTGSDLINTKKIIKDLSFLIEEYRIRSILDLACGDFTWMKKINLENVNYIGVDIVSDLIRLNTNNYSKKI